MKTINKRDIKSMVKKFGLSEEETREVEILSEYINEEEDDSCVAINSPLRSGASYESERVALCALIVYFGKRVNRSNILQETAWKLSRILKCNSYTLGLWIKKISKDDDRFGKFVEYADLSGLKYLKIK